MRGLLVGALLAVVMPASGALADAVVYTPARGTLCQDRSKPEFGYWICPGPGGYVASFSDEGNLSAVSIARGKARKPATTSEFLGAGRVFGDKVEWHLVDGKPKSAVLRAAHEHSRVTFKAWKSTWLAARFGIACSGARCTSATGSSWVHGPRSSSVTASSLSGANSRFSCIRKPTRNTRLPASNAK